MLTEEDEACFVRGCVSSHNVTGLADRLYLPPVLEAIGAKTDE
jgi:hypothetical protein